jgi:hypothetical protein
LVCPPYMAPGNLYHIPLPPFSNKHINFSSFSASCSMNIRLPPHFLFGFVESIVKLQLSVQEIRVCCNGQQDQCLAACSYLVILSSVSICYWQFASLTLYPVPSVSIILGILKDSVIYEDSDIISSPISYT